MNNETLPRVSVGIPVYNGEKYIRFAIESILNQTFYDFELIISDNASTDSTGEICKSYAEKDSRIRYYRNSSNIGLFQNYNHLFELSRGEYFIWLAYDDTRAPEFLAKAVEFLDNNPTFVLCYAKEMKMNKEGKITTPVDFDSECDSVNVQKRVRDVLVIPTVSTEALIRSDKLKKTRLNLEFIGSDWTLALELALLGRFHQIPERLYFRRSHAESSMKLFTKHERMSFSNPSKANKISFPTWRLCYEDLKSIFRAELPMKDKLHSYRELFHWFNKDRTLVDLRKDIRMAAKKVIVHSRFGETFMNVYHRGFRSTVKPKDGWKGKDNIFQNLLLIFLFVEMLRGIISHWL